MSTIRNANQRARTMERSPLGPIVGSTGPHGQARPESAAPPKSTRRHLLPRAMHHERESLRVHESAGMLGVVALQADLFRNFPANVRGARSRRVRRAGAVTDLALNVAVRVLPLTHDIAVLRTVSHDMAGNAHGLVVAGPLEGRFVETGGGARVTPLAFWHGA